MPDLESKEVNVAPPRTRFISKINDSIYIIKIEDILYFHSKYRGVYVVTRDGKSYLINYTLKQLEEMLNPDEFFRLNRKIIASINAILKVTTFSSSRLKVELKFNDERILTPKEKVGAFKGWLGA